MEELHIIIKQFISSPAPASIMGFSVVTRSSEGYVKPAAPTPSGTLTLNWIDRYPTHRGLVDSLHVYKHGRAPAKVIKEALSKALVYYYPVAGRIVQVESSCDPRVDCTGDGVWFVEAYTDCTLEDVNYLDQRPMTIPKEDLVPYDKLHIDAADTIVMMQVTEFKCGGFVMGLRFNHAFGDGLGSGQLNSAISELARGLPEPSTKPVWERDAYPNPRVKPAPLPDLPKMSLEYVQVDFPTSYINQLKKQYQEHSPAASGRWCSTFDVLIAKTWQCRARATAAVGGARMCFFASTRHILKPSEGFYGNSIFSVKVDSTGEEIAEKLTVAEVVDLIKGAKERMAEEVLRWAGDELEEDPFKMTFNYETVYVSDWTKLGFSELDFGWGRPEYCAPFGNNEFIASCVLLKSPAPLDGTRLIARCVSEEHLDEFRKLLIKFD